MYIVFIQLLEEKIISMFQINDDNLYLDQEIKREFIG